MAFPTIPTGTRVRFLNDTGTASPQTRTFDAFANLTFSAGDLLLAVVTTYQSTTNPQFSSWSHSFTEISDQGSSTTMGVGVAWKIADGTETGSLTVSQAGTVTGEASLCIMSIPGASTLIAPEVLSPKADGTSAAADAGALTPSWGAQDTLWVAVAGSGMTSGTGSWTATGTTYPANYTNGVDSNTTDSSRVGQVEIAVAFRQLNASSENIGTFGVDTSNARNTALVIAVAPDLSVSITPTVGALDKVGYAPGVRPSVQPSADALTTAGYAPTVTIDSGATNTDRNPTTGSVSVTGQQAVFTRFTPVERRNVHLTPSGFVEDFPVASNLTPQGFVEGGVEDEHPLAATLSLGGYAPTVDVSAGGTNITPSADVLATAGYAPTLSVTDHRSITPSTAAVSAGGTSSVLGLAVPSTAGLLSITGYAPLHNRGVLPLVGTLALTGYAPLHNRGVITSTGTATLTGYAPTVTLISGITPATGVLGISGAAPTVSTTGADVVLAASSNVPAGGTTPTTGQLTPPTGKVVGDFQAGYISDDTNPVPSLDPSIDRYTEVEWVIKFTDAATLDQYEFRVTDNGTPLTGYSYYPRLTRQSSALEVTPDVGSLLLTGYAPTVQSANQILPVAGSLDITGYAPTTFQRWYITPPAATLAFSGITPAVKTDFRLTPAVGTVTVASVAPVARTDTRITPAAAEAAVIGQAPTVRKDEYLVPGTGALAVIGYTPGLFNPLLITPAVQALALTGYAPSLFQQALVTPGTGSLTIQGLAPSLFKQNFVTPATGALEISGTTVTQGIVVTPATGGLVITGATPVAPEAIQRAPAVGALGLTGYAPSVLVRTLITPQVGRVVITPVGAIVNTNGRLTATLDNATLAGSGVVPVTGALAVTLDTLTISTPPPYMWDTSQGKAGSNRPVVRLPESYTPQDEQDLKDIMHIITALGAIWR